MRTAKATGLFALVLLMHGCAQIIPARVQQIEAGRYALTSTGNMFASKQTLAQIIDSQAAIICGDGKYQYEVEGNVQQAYSPMLINDFLTDVSYKTLTKVVKCQKK